MNDGAALHLTKSVIRQKDKLEPYRDEEVRIMLRETKLLYEDACRWRATLGNSHSLYENSDHEAKLVALKHVIERNKRILLAYHNSRLNTISAYSSALECLPRKMVEAMAVAEVDFEVLYRENLRRYDAQFGGIVDLIQVADPPRDLHVQIRVNQDCGTIQTEWGQLHLSANSFHYLKRSDVKNLIDQGLVSHIP